MAPKPIRISIPINLRRFFGSGTMRNFVLAVEPGIDPRLGEFTFEEIITKVHYYMRTQLDHRFIRRQIVRNVQGENNPFIKIVPRGIKDLVLRRMYSVFGTPDLYPRVLESGPGGDTRRDETLCTGLSLYSAAPR